MFNYIGLFGRAYWTRTRELLALLRVLVRRSVAVRAEKVEARCAVAGVSSRLRMIDLRSRDTRYCGSGLKVLQAKLASSL